MKNKIALIGLLIAYEFVEYLLTSSAFGSIMYQSTISHSLNDPPKYIRNYSWLHYCEPPFLPGFVSISISHPHTEYHEYIHLKLHPNSPNIQASGDVGICGLIF